MKGQVIFEVYGENRRVKSQLSSCSLSALIVPCEISSFLTLTGEVIERLIELWHRLQMNSVVLPCYFYILMLPYTKVIKCPGMNQNNRVNTFITNVKPVYRCISFKFILSASSHSPSLFLAEQRIQLLRVGPAQTQEICYL